MDDSSSEPIKKTLKPKASPNPKSSAKPKTGPRPKTSPKPKASSKSKVGTSDPKPKSKTASSKPETTNAVEDPKSRITTAVMVVRALEELGSRKGSSLHAIKKCVGEKYNVDIDKITHLIKRYLKSAVDKGDIVQTKGVGAVGSFRLGSKKKKEKGEKAVRPKNTTSTKKTLEENAKPTKKKAETIIKKAESSKKKIESTKKKAESTEKSKSKKKQDLDTTQTKEPKEKKVKMVKEKKKATDFSNERRTSMLIKVPAKRRKSMGTLVKAPKMKPKIPKPKLKKEKSV